jgi:hypothetical protein
MDQRFTICTDGRIAVGELLGLSRVMGYIAQLPNGRFRAERLDRSLMSEEEFDSENNAAIFIEHSTLSR